MSFTSLNLDPLLGTEIIDLLGIHQHEVDNPRKFRKLEEIVSFFSAVPNHRSVILKMLSGKQGEKIDILWTYVALEHEKQEHIAKLNPDDFAPDVETQLKQKYLTADNLKMLRKDIAVKKEKIKKEPVDTKKDKAVGKVFDETKLNLYEETLKGLENINQKLLAYE